MKVIKNVDLVLRDHFLPDGVVLIENGLITAFGKAKDIEIPANAEVIDGEGYYLAPGLVDQHCHAQDMIRFTEDPVTACKTALEHGVTTILATLAYNQTMQEHLDGIKKIREAKDKGLTPNCGGINMEGPFLNIKFGSNRVNHPWAHPICAEDYDVLINAVGDEVKIWAIAPEREGTLEFVKAAKAAQPGVKFGVGHSEAAPSEIEPLLEYDLCIGVHHTNATGDLPKYSECRGVCVDETVNYNDAIYAEIISDSRGIHVDPYMQRLVRKIKGDDRICLISDASSQYGPTPPGYEGVTDLCFDDEGEIAGSKLTLDVAAQNFMVHTGASLVDVIKMASYNPAKVIGYKDRGEIAVGKRADLILVDHKMNIKKVFPCGIQA